jgi:hypothetical protein
MSKHSKDLKKLLYGVRTLLGEMHSFRLYYNSTPNVPIVNNPPQGQMLPIVNNPPQGQMLLPPQNDTASNDSNNRLTCNVCLTNTINMVLGCGHTICNVCHDRLTVKICTVCRAPIIRTNPLFIGGSKNKYKEKYLKYKKRYLEQKMF